MSKVGVFKFATSLLFTFSIFQLCSSSAIPMWEYLSRSEKMSHLSLTFANQVSDYCKRTFDGSSQFVTIAQCKRELLTHGLEKLRQMPDTHLDGMDPYQRDANQLIWGLMLQGYPSDKQNPMTTSLTSSAVIFPSTTKYSNKYPQNPMFDNANAGSTSYAMEMDKIYSNNGGSEIFYPTSANSIIYEPITNNWDMKNNAQIYQPKPTSSEITTYLSGPMVIRVLPDGTPVEEDKFKQLPADDDREAMLFIDQHKIPKPERFSRGQQQTEFSSFINNNNYRNIQRH